MNCLEGIGHVMQRWSRKYDVCARVGEMESREFAFLVICSFVFLASHSRYWRSVIREMLTKGKKGCGIFSHSSLRSIFLFEFITASKGKVFLTIKNDVYTTHGSNVDLRDGKTTVWI